MRIAYEWQLYTPLNTLNPTSIAYIGYSKSYPKPNKRRGTPIQLNIILYMKRMSKIFRISK